MVEHVHKDKEVQNWGKNNKGRCHCGKKFTGNRIGCSEGDRTGCLEEHSWNLATRKIYPLCLQVNNCSSEDLCL